MKRFVTVVAFSVSSLVSFGHALVSTPVEAIPHAEKVEVYFHADSDADYLQSVQMALARRGITLKYTELAYDEEGKLRAIAFEVDHGGPASTTTTATITRTQAAYLFVDFHEAPALAQLA